MLGAWTVVHSKRQSKTKNPTIIVKTLPITKPVKSDLKNKIKAENARKREKALENINLEKQKEMVQQNEHLKNKLLQLGMIPDIKSDDDYRFNECSKIHKLPLNDIRRFEFYKDQIIIIINKIIKFKSTLTIAQIINLIRIVTDRSHSKYHEVCDKIDILLTLFIPCYSPYENDLCYKQPINDPRVQKELREIM